MIWSVVALLIAQPPVSERWEVVEDSETMTWRIDNGSLRRDGDIVIYWERLSLKSASQDGWSGSTVQVELNCRQQTTRSLYMQFEFSNGNPPMSGATPDSEATPIMPESVAETIMRRICT